MTGNLGRDDTGSKCFNGGHEPTPEQHMHISSWGAAGAALCLLTAACSSDDSDAGTEQPAAQDTAADVGAQDSGADDAMSDASDTTAADTAGECPAGAGCACKENTDCDSALCIDTPDGRQCARSCVDACPDAGFRCAQVTSPTGDVASICVPTWGRLCDPCSDSKACEALGMKNPSCVDRGDAGAFCGAACSAEKDCPSDYLCADATSVEGVKSKQCTPLVGADCKCSKAASDAQLMTACYLQVTDKDGKKTGTCAGERKCASSGLTKCSAAAGEDEACDGKDNDCDGDTDEATCDDKNACTQDICDPEKTGDERCSHKKLTSACNADDNVCTVADVCEDGVCTPGSAKQCDDSNPCTLDVCDASKGCVQAPDNGAPCDDENPCTIGDICKAGGCAAGKPKSCVSSDVCVTAKCQQTTGKCELANQPEGLQCDDGTVCTKDDVCKAGACTGAVFVCDDSQACTDNKCDPIKGCQFIDNSIPCDDGNKCTTGDACQDGGCAGGKASTCDDGNPCTTDSCNAQTGSCDNPANTGPCGDGNACTVGDVCAAGKCKSGVVKNCDDSNPCTVDACDANNGDCANLPNAASCTDGDACTIGDACTGGSCQAGTPQACADNDACTADACDSASGKCASKPIPGCGGNCDKPADCDDKNPCTTNACVGGKCAFGANSAPCDDGKKCTLGDTCDGGACAAGPAPNCDDGQICTADTCDEGTGACAHKPLTTTCDDGDPCTLSDVCKAGKCAAGTTKDCSDSQPCTDDKCDGKTGDCQHPGNSAKCDDGNACTVGDTCAQGACVGGPAKSCDDKNGCTNDSCNAATGACSSAPNTAQCSDDDVCTVGDVCGKSACQPGAKKGCSDARPCTDDVCDKATGACSNPANTAACDDGDACTSGDQCGGGACQSGATKSCDDKDACSADSCNPTNGACSSKAIIGCGGNCASKADCDDKNPCTDDACSAGKCAVSANTKPCNDGDPCTLGDSCGSGHCQAGIARDCDDSNPCTTDSCGGAKGECAHQASAGKCSDDNACTAGDDCKAGSCAPGAAISCDDGKVCTNDVCNIADGSCAHLPNEITCTDGDACTLVDACKGGGCQPGATKDCDDKETCTVDSCNTATGACQNAAKSGPCDDNDACTGGDLCDGGACKPGTPKGCQDGNVCTDDACDSKTGACVFTANAAKCTDNNACTLIDVCTKSACKPGAPAKCDDSDACTTDKCAPDSGKCVSVPIIGCGGNCGSADDCKDGNPCTDDACTAGKCAFSNNTAACDDNKPCTVADVCAGGSCQSGGLKDCDDGNTCTNDSCDWQTGKCQHVNNTNACTDGSVCTTGDVCDGGKCVAGGPKICKDTDVCTDDKCDAIKGCQFPHNTAPCVDNVKCTVNDVCKAGKCTSGPPKDCDDGRDCTIDTCNGGNGECYSNNAAWGAPCAGGKGVCEYSTCWEYKFLQLKTLTVGYNSHACGVRSDDLAICWGLNQYGQLGTGSTAPVTVADTPVKGLGKVLDVGPGENRSCAVTMAGVVKCWGQNITGALDPNGGATKAVPEPTTIAGLPTATRVLMGYHYSCAMTAAKEYWCWGTNAIGQFGTGADTAKLQSTKPWTPIKVDNLKGMDGVKLAPNGGCGFKAGKSFCWGQNAYGRFGIGEGNMPDLFGPGGFGDKGVVMTGVSFTFATLSTANTLLIAGRNENGQCGTGDTVHVSSPKTPPGLPPIAMFGVGVNMAVAITTAGELWSWGGQSGGQLGDSTSAPKLVLKPTKVPGFQDLVDVQVAPAATCVRKKDGSTWCFGSNGPAQLTGPYNPWVPYSPRQIVESKTKLQ